MHRRRGTTWLRVLRTPVGGGAALLLAAVLLLAIFAPMLWDDQANAVDTAHILQGSSAQHWAGTDHLGRDIFFRVLVATRLSIELALLATLIGVTVGIILGSAPSVLGRRLGRFFTGLVNLAVAFPALLLALFFAVIFGIGATGAVLAIGLATAPAFARLAQTLATTVTGRDFVAAARVAGVSRPRLLARHILPNIAEPLAVNATIGAGTALLAFAGLSFLGLGVQPPLYDWGRLLGDGLQSIYIHPLAAIAPGVAVVIAGLAFNLFGEAIAKALGTPTALPRYDGLPHPKNTRICREPTPPLDYEDLLDVQNLTVTFPRGQQGVTPVREVSFRVSHGEAVGVVGESGSGKSLTALAIAQLIEHPGMVTADRLSFNGERLLNISAKDQRRMLSTSMAMLFQDSRTSFNPTIRVGKQLAEVARYHHRLSRRRAHERAVDRLRSVRIPAAPYRAHQYPHEFSGGMLQRAMVGMGVMDTPQLILADEPTTALDVTVQRQVLRLLARIRTDSGSALLLISHDIGVVRQVCDRVLVMYAGKIVEDLPINALRQPQHPYTHALLMVAPDLQTDKDKPLDVIPGRPLQPSEFPVGCAFAARCPLADDRCRSEDPPLIDHGGGHRVACWHPGQIGHTPAASSATGPVSAERA